MKLAFLVFGLLALSLLVGASHCNEKTAAKDCNDAEPEYDCSNPSAGVPKHACDWITAGFKPICKDHFPAVIAAACKDNQVCDAKNGCNYVYCQKYPKACESLPEVTKNGKCYSWYCEWEFFDDYCDLKEKQCPITTTMPTDVPIEVTNEAPTVTEMPPAETTTTADAFGSNVDAYGGGETDAMAGQSADYRMGYAEGYSAGSAGAAGARVGSVPSAKSNPGVPSLSSSAIVGLMLVVLLVIAGFASMRSKK